MYHYLNVTSLSLPFADSSTQNVSSNTFSVSNCYLYTRPFMCPTDKNIRERVSVL